MVYIAQLHIYIYVDMANQPKREKMMMKFFNKLQFLICILDDVRQLCPYLMIKFIVIVGKNGYEMFPNISFYSNSALVQNAS